MIPPSQRETGRRSNLAAARGRSEPFPMGAGYPMEATTGIGSVSLRGLRFDRRCICFANPPLRDLLGLTGSRAIKPRRALTPDNDEATSDRVRSCVNPTIGTSVRATGSGPVRHLAIHSWRRPFGEPHTVEPRVFDEDTFSVRPVSRSKPRRTIASSRRNLRGVQSLNRADRGRAWRRARGGDHRRPTYVCTATGEVQCSTVLRQSFSNMAT